MTLEKSLLKTIEEYEKLLQSGEASPEKVLSIHQRMKPLQDRFFYVPETSLVKAYSIIHPNSRVIRAEHSTSPIAIENSNGKINIQYLLEDDKVTAVYLFALDFFFPRSNEEGKWWHHQKGCYQDIVENKTEFGYMDVMKADGKGSFWSSEARAINPKIESSLKQLGAELKEKESRRIKMRLWDTGLKDEAINEIFVSRLSLEKGDLTAFFNHIDYRLLDDLYK